MNPLRLLRPANPLVRALLASPAHPLLSRRLVVLTYQGHRSGRVFSIPLRYAELRDGGLVALAVDKERKLWWRSFTQPRSATLTLYRKPVPVRGVVVDGRRRDEALAAYTTRYRRSSGLARDAALVVFERAG